MQLPQAEEVVEHLGLDDLGRLGHADPVGQPGQLDRRRHRDEIAVALGQGVVDGDQAVFGRLGRRWATSAARDSVSCVGRRDEDRARVELEDAAAVDDARRAGARTGCRATRAGAPRLARRGVERKRTRASCARSRRRSRDRPSGPRGRWYGPGRFVRLRCGSRRAAGCGSRATEPLAGTDRDVEPVLGRRQRARPARIERARRLEREVEVDDERAPRPGRRRGRRSCAVSTR